MGRQIQADKAKQRVVVVGAGIIGASIAFHLAMRGAAVTLVDAKQPGQGASYVSFAWMNARSKQPRHYHDLNRRSVDMWDRFTRLLGGDVGLTWGGELRWATTLHGATEFVDQVRELQGWGYPIHLIDEAELRRAMPELGDVPVTAASFTECDGHVDTSLVIRRCVENMRSRGGDLLANTRVSGLRLEQTVKAVVTERGELPCDVVVLAGGPDTSQLAAYAGIQVPLHHTFGCTIITDPMPPLWHDAALVHTHHDFKPQMAFRQLANGSLMIHGGLHGSSLDRSLGETAEEVQIVLSAAASIFPPIIRAGIAEIRHGRRPMPADGHPLVGFSQTIPNLYLAATHSGVTLAPLIGDFASLEILHGTRIETLASFRPERFTQ